MRFFAIGSILAVMSGTSVHADVVQITDGRSVDLRDDGTYELVDTTRQLDDEFVEYGDHYFERHTDKYRRDTIRFMPIYKNISERRILAVKFTTQFLNSFGEEIFIFSGETEEPVSNGVSSTNNLFYKFEDNKFMNGEPYDKLLPMVLNKSGNIKVVLDMIVFDGGEIIDLSD